MRGVSGGGWGSGAVQTVTHQPHHSSLAARLVSVVTHEMNWALSSSSHTRRTRMISPQGARALHRSCYEILLQMVAPTRWESTRRFGNQFRTAQGSNEPNDNDFRAPQGPLTASALILRANAKAESMRRLLSLMPLPARLAAQHGNNEASLWLPLPERPVRRLHNAEWCRAENGA